MSEGNNQVDPTRLSLEQAAKLLSAAFRERTRRCAGER